MPLAFLRRDGEQGHSLRIRERVGRDFGLFFCFLVVLAELLDHHASRDEDVDHDQAEVEEAFGQDLLGQVNLHGDTSCVSETAASGSLGQRGDRREQASSQLILA